MFLQGRIIRIGISVTMWEETDKFLGTQSSDLLSYCINQLRFLKHRKRGAITLGVKKNKVVAVVGDVFVMNFSDSSVFCC